MRAIFTLKYWATFLLSLVKYCYDVAAEVDAVNRYDVFIGIDDDDSGDDVQTEHRSEVLAKNEDEKKFANASERAYNLQHDEVKEILIQHRFFIPLLDATK